jgi:hypothetical protein
MALCRVCKKNKAVLNGLCLICSDYEALAKAGLGGRRKRRYTKAHTKRADGKCALYPECNNNTVGKSTYCEEHKKIVKRNQT